MRESESEGTSECSFNFASHLYSGVYSFFFFSLVFFFFSLLSPVSPADSCETVTFQSSGVSLAFEVTHKHCPVVTQCLLRVFR